MTILPCQCRLVGWDAHAPDADPRAGRRRVAKVRVAESRPRSRKPVPPSNRRDGSVKAAISTRSFGAADISTLQHPTLPSNEGLRQRFPEDFQWETKANGDGRTSV